MLLKLGIEIEYLKFKGIEKIRRVIMDEGGSNDGGGMNFALGLAGAVIIFGVIIAAAKLWFPDALQKLFEKAETVMGI